MSKPIDEPIVMMDPQVRVGHRFVWRGREHRIESVGGAWARRGRWWRGEGYRRYVRVTTLDNVALDLCYDESAECWTVAEMMD